MYFVEIVKWFSKIKIRLLNGRRRRGITTEEFDRRRAIQSKPLAEEYEAGVLRQGAITRDLRRHQVDEYNEDSAPKQARMRDISGHHLYRERMITPSQDKSTDVVALSHNAKVVSVHRHIVEILKLQNCDGAYFNSLNESDKENARQHMSEIVEGK